MKAKKHLSLTALRKMISAQIRSWPDHRQRNSTTHSFHDVVMSGLACMYFQEPSLLQFQKEMEEIFHQNNLRSLFNVQTIPSSNAMKDVLDNLESRRFNPIFKEIIQRLQRGKQLKQYNLLPGLTVCSIDGTQYHHSTSIHCDHCLTKKHTNKPTVYYHTALQAAMMHPDIKHVIPVMAEPIQNKDGTTKQDCEINAAKRLIPLLRNQFPKMGLIITGDDLFSRQPMIKTVLTSNFHFFFVAKPSSHKCLMESLENRHLHEILQIDEKGRHIIYQWTNSIPLNGNKDTIKVNYFSKKMITFDHNGKQKSCRTSSWVTDLEITEQNVVLFTQGARSRWKVENECFNTLKNQGYHLTHNYGHGEKYLAFNFYLLTLLAFTLHQISELCDNAFQACRKKAGSKRSLWEKFRTFIVIGIFKNMEQFYNFYLNIDDHDIINGYVIERRPP